MTTATHVANSVVPLDLPGQELRVPGDRVYCGQHEVVYNDAAGARDFTDRRCRYKELSVRNRMREGLQQVESVGRSARPFLCGKCAFDFAKVCYERPAKSANRLCITRALADSLCLVC